MSGHFVISSVGDTYLDMSSYKKGYLWVNGYLLGRYWDRGPQRRLYCPGVWLKNGKNEFKIL
jgi:beta-galactosidase